MNISTDFFSSLEKKRLVEGFSVANAPAGDYCDTGYADIDENLYHRTSVSIVALGGGLCTPVGFRSDETGKIVVETTLFGVNPDYWEDANGGYHAEHITVCVNGAANGTASLVDAAILALNAWDTNFQHFMVETFPRIYRVVELARRLSIPIIVMRTPWVESLLREEFPDVGFLYVEADKPIRCRHTYFIEAAAKNFTKIVAIQIEAFNALYERNRAPDATRQGAAGFLYRQPLPEHIGAGRAILNQDAVDDVLRKHDVETFFLEKMTFRQKSYALSKYNYVLSPIGANLVNLILSHRDTLLCVLEHPQFVGGPWFAELFARMGFTQPARVLNITRLDDAPLPINSPYFVETDLLDQSLADARHRTA